MHLSSVEDTTAMHIHSGVPRPYKLHGEFFCLAMSREDFAALTEREVHQLTRSWSQAYEYAEDGSGGRFYLKPRPRVRFLAAYGSITLEQLRMVVELTNESVKILEGQSVYELMRFFFLEAASELGGREEWRFDAAALYRVTNTNTIGGGNLVLEIPSRLLALLRSYPELYKSATKRLMLLCSDVQIREAGSRP